MQKSHNKTNLQQLLPKVRAYSQWHIGNTSLINIIKELHYQQLRVFKGHLALSPSVHCASHDNHWLVLLMSEGQSR